MTKAEATQKAKVLLARMKGTGWKIRVFENLGWHYGVETDRLSVRGTEINGDYFCLLKPHFTFFGAVGRSKTDPNKAVQATLRNARASLAGYNQILAEANNVYVNCR